MSLLDLSNYALLATCIFILFGSVYISFKTRFVQVRLLGNIFKTLFDSISKSSLKDSKHTLKPHKALFTAMSTTLGISTIVAPSIAIHLGGPGALIGFLLTAFFGSAATFMEVNLAINHREKTTCGKIVAGPMPYLTKLLSKKMATIYAFFCLLLMLVWSGAQSNQLAAILDSHTLGNLRISKEISAIFITALVIFSLFGGVKRIGAISSKLVPIMFCLYLGSCLWIIGCNLSKLGIIFEEIYLGLFSYQELANGAIVGGIVSALRYGIFKGIQTTEAGIGTQSIPHSLANTEDSLSQATLAMLSTYTAGFIAFLSGIVALITNTWQDPNLPLGIGMVIASFEIYFSFFGVILISITALLFGFGTILGNSFNANECFSYLTKNKQKVYFFIFVAIMIFMGAILETKLVWSLIDFVLAMMAIPHMLALILQASRESKKQPVILSDVYEN
jgi:AGCS family alanine or glycine:cation symporter